MPTVLRVIVGAGPDYQCTQTVAVPVPGLTPVADCPW